MNSQTVERGSLERTLHIAAAPQTVFAFLVEPEKLIQWMGEVAQFDPRPGGQFRLRYNASAVASGVYIAVEPPRRVAFSWGWEADHDSVTPGSSTVEITLEPDGDGTLLRLTHSDLPADAVASHSLGWDQFLPELITSAESAGA